MRSSTPNPDSRRLGPDALGVLFTEARTHNGWLDRKVDDNLLRELYDLMKWGPTSANCCPVRILFLRTRESKERLKPALQPTNVQKTMEAPATAILAYDSGFYETLPRLFPAMPSIKDMFLKDPDLAATTAMRNASLQGAYFILAARSLGLDCGPMSGFDNAKVDQAFFSAASPGASTGSFVASGPVKSNFLCNLGHGDWTKLRPRGPRLEFNEACQLV
jgi:3-hydroxypropanoate dehydrogenase